MRTAAITVALLIGLGAFMAVTGDRSARNDLQHLIDTDIAGLSDVYAGQGLEGLANRIADRTSIEPRDRPQAGYLLLDAAGRRLAGNLPDQPIRGYARSELQRVRLGDNDHAMARATMLKGGVRLVVARSVAHVVRLIVRLTTTFFVGGVLMVALAGLGALLSSRRLQKRLDAFDAAFAQVEAGDLSVRVPEDRGVDELSVLTRDVNGMLAQFQRLLASQRKITDQTAHEIRTPLMHLDTTLVRAIVACGPADAELLQQGRAEIRDVVALLDSLLDIARLEAMQGDPRGLASFDLSGLAREMCELYAASFDEAGLTFETRVAPDVALFGDRVLTTRLLANLLDNAVKYAPSPGRVRLSVDPGPRIVVEDDGPGVPLDKRDWVFDRYTRIAPDGRAGHGLGLALVRAIAEREGLSARVDDAGPGARFVVEPPLAAAS